MPPQWTVALIINFAFLAMIRGTTPLMMHFAVEALNSATLLVALKCAITTLLFLLSLIWFATKDSQVHCQIINSLRDKKAYCKLIVIGLLQSAIPYILAVYSLRYLPPSLLGAFMVTTPWWSMLIQRLPFISITIRIPGMVKFGMFLGGVGILCMFAPTIRESIYCEPNYFLNTTNKSTEMHIITPSERRKYKFDTCLTATEVFTGFLSMFIAPVLWGSATVYWKMYRRDIHYLLSSVGQNFVGFLVCIVIWLIASSVNQTDLPIWNDGKGLTGLIFLGVCTGWLATLLVNYLFVSVGAKTTNQVLAFIPFIAFIEDVAFVKDVITDSPWIIALQIMGVMLVTGGVFISNIKFQEAHTTYTGPSHTAPRNRERRNSLESPLLYNEPSTTSDTDSLSAMAEQQYFPPPLLDDENYPYSSRRLDSSNIDERTEEEIDTSSHQPELLSNEDAPVLTPS